MLTELVSKEEPTEKAKETAKYMLKYGDMLGGK